MAPIEPDLTNSNLLPLSLFAGYLALTIGLTGLISYDVLFKAYKALPPSQDTRHRKPNRDKHVQLFAVLTLISLALSWVHMTRSSLLSYRVWAHDMGQTLPVQVFGSEGLQNLSLGRWLSDSSFYQDAWEITIEKSRRFWWTQQLLSGLAAWSVFVGIEGRRRHIRHLWAFPLLSQLIGLSFGLNLFFLSILLAPIPLPMKTGKPAQKSLAYELSSSSAINPAETLFSQFRASSTRALRTIQTYLPPLPSRPHPEAWTPHPLALITPLLVAQVSTFLIPFATSTTSFVPLVVIMSVFPYRLIYLDRLGPIAYGSMSKPGRNYLIVYRYLSYVSFALFLKQTFVALLDNDPGAHEHRHSHYLAKLHLPREHERSALNRSSSSIGKVLGALNDHPAMAAVGYDVLLCAFSLFCWAVVRGLEVTKVLAAAGIMRSPSSASAGTTKHKSQTSNANTSAVTTTPVRRRKRKSTATEDAPKTPADDKAAKGDSTFHPASPDTALSIPRGEEEEPENPEAAAVGGTLFVLGGLGVLAAGILGAESM